MSRALLISATKMSSNQRTSKRILRKRSCSQMHLTICFTKPSGVCSHAVNELSPGVGREREVKTTVCLFHHQQPFISEYFTGSREIEGLFFKKKLDQCTKKIKQYLISIVTLSPDVSPVFLGRSEGRNTRQDGDQHHVTCTQPRVTPPEPRFRSSQALRSPLNKISFFYFFFFNVALWSFKIIAEIDP